MLLSEGRRTTASNCELQQSCGSCKVSKVLSFFVRLMLHFPSIPLFLTLTALSSLRDQSEDLASAYANRAACLLRLACPQFALTDIELALENGSDLFLFLRLAIFLK